MSQHYTLNTIEVSSWCRVCGKDTMHKVQNRLLGPCLVCLAKPTKPSRPKPVKPPKSGELFAPESTLLPK
jgi:hypothetical protein